MVLTCGHSFCVTCLSKCGRVCPVCRQETNDLPDTVAETMRLVTEKINRNPSLSKDGRRINVKECCDMIMSVHYKVLFMGSFRTAYIKKVEDLSVQGMDAKKLLKQIESFTRRMTVAFQ